MPADQHIQEGDNPRPRPFQFSLRSLLAAVTLTAIFLSCLFGGPDWVAGLAAGLVFIAAPVTFITILVYGHGYQRTFCIGALTFVGALLLSPTGFPYYLIFVFDGTDDTATRCYVLVGFVAGTLIAAAFGLLAILVRRMIEPVPSAPENRSDEPADDVSRSPIA